MRRNTNSIASKESAEKYPFTSKIICDNCSKKYKRKTIKGRIYWGCSTNIKYGKSSCRAKLIPDELLRSISVEVIGVEEFDEEIFNEKIRVIHAKDPETLLFAFHDGSSILKKWTNKSRRESWNAEAKQRAREKELERRGRECQ